MLKLDKYRGDWVRNSKAVVGPAFYWSNVDTIVIHYPGVDWASMDFDKNGVTDWRDTAVMLDNTNAYYWNSRGYAIGYNVCVDIFGVSWELRGDTFKNAANLNHNDHTISLKLTVDAENPATLPQVEKARQMVAQFRVLAGRDLPIVGHGSLYGAQTSCPGAGIRAQIAAGEFEPRPEYPQPVLKLRDRKQAVVTLKHHLRFWGFMPKYPVVPTPYYGLGTRSAVKKLQASLNITQTGVWDLKTYDAYVKFTSGK